MSAMGGVRRRMRCVAGIEAWYIKRSEGLTGNKDGDRVNV